MAESLWGSDFVIEETPKVAKKIKEKITKPKTSSESNGGVSRRKKTNSMPLHEQLNNIKTNVYKILGVYKDNTVVIRTREQLTAYIDAAIKNGAIAVDTETNNSLDPITCKLMGPCI